jgi:hypothetical protein
MPQLSLYIDETTLHKIESAAKMEHKSLSKYVVGKLNESMNKDWPSEFHTLYGIIEDDTFDLDRVYDFHDDIHREVL